MNIALFGASGFIGKNLLVSLRKNGKHNIKCFVRDNTSESNVEFIKVNEGKITYDISRTVLNADIVINCAGQLGKSNLSVRELYDSNVILLSEILSNKNPSQKLIHVSSAGVYGSCINASENSIPNPDNAYERSKLRAEKLLDKVPNVTILRPGLLYGEYDLHLLGFYKAIKNRQFLLINNGEALIQPTYVGDLIECILACFTLSEATHVINISGETISFQNFYENICKELSIRPFKLSISDKFAKWIANFTGPIFNLLNLSPILTGDRISLMSKTRTYNSLKCKKILGREFIELSKGLNKTFEYYRRMNLI